MSVFRTQTLNCPSCDTAVEFDLVISVNADRRPDLRDAILDGSFQRQVCPSCSASFRVDPEFTYLDLKRGQYIGVWPAAKRGQWRELAAQTQEAFDAAFGKNAPAAARKIAGKVEPRVVFGWPALTEKILAKQAGIDDRTLELAKIVVARNSDEMPVPGRRELRLVGTIGEDLVVAWVAPADGRAGDLKRVARKVVADIEARPDDWKELRDNVGEGLLVDFQREMLAA
jgi:hypothetical protein